MNIDNTSIDNTTSIDNIPLYKCRLYEPRVSITSHFFQCKEIGKEIVKEKWLLKGRMGSCGPDISVA